MPKQKSHPRSFFSYLRLQLAKAGWNAALFGFAESSPSIPGITAPQSQGLQERKETLLPNTGSEEMGEPSWPNVLPTHQAGNTAVGCAVGLVFGMVGSEAEGAGNCYSAVLVSMTRAFITCAPWGKRHNLDSAADNSAVLCLWDKGRLLVL